MAETPGITGRAKYSVLASAILAWLFAGILMAIPPLAARAAVRSMGVTDEGLRASWFAWYVSAFLLGAAAGGFLFGWLGDRFGRTRALAASVLTYSLVAGACYFVQTPEQLLVMWFVACTGVGGAWPNGISLASEVLPDVSRPWLSGVFGTAANLGLMLMAALAYLRPITADDWRWVMLVAAAPAVLGVFTLIAVPESPAWLAQRRTGPTESKPRGSISDLVRPPLLKYTILGVLLGTVPQLGNWGGTNWLVPWADRVSEQVGGESLGAWTQWMKSSGAAVGALIGGWLASLCGRRTAYFLVSAAALVSGFYIFYSLTPEDESFLTWVFIQGFFGTVYFGWLPLYLPELFPTHVRATGTGVAFNWGRIATAAGVLLGGQLVLTFGGDYARVGQVTCMVYALGMILICFAPDTSRTTIHQDADR